MGGRCHDPTRRISACRRNILRGYGGAVERRLVAPTGTEMRIEVSPPDQIVVFDGVCNLCSHSAQFIVRHDRQHAFKLATAQSAAGRALLIESGLDPEKLETFVLLKAGRAYMRSDAALEIARTLNPPWRTLRILRVIPRMLRDPLYDLIARNRYRWFGKKDRCMMPTDDIRSRFIE